MENEELLQIRKMTIDEVKANPPKIDRKFVLINSSLYTNEAFEYILELVNETDSVLFIRDIRKIYTKGEYFGGDVWENSLFYFGTFQLLNDNEEEIAKIKSEVDNETLRIQGLNNITLVFEETYVNGEKVKTLKIGYDLANSIDISRFTIDDPTAKFNLEIKDEKIAINKYIPIRVEVDQNNTLFEYDNAPDLISFDIHVYGTSENKNIIASSGTNEEITFNEDYTSVTATVTPNITNDYLILYSDEENQGSVIYQQKFGYAVCYSNSEIKKDNFKSLDRIILNDSCECTFSINQRDNEYGWFTCPSIYKPIFIDEYSGLRGGWFKYGTFKAYSLGIDYDIWRTENYGLGLNVWTIKENK